MLQRAGPARGKLEISGLLLWLARARGQIVLMRTISFAGAVNRQLFRDVYPAIRTWRHFGRGIVGRAQTGRLTPVTNALEGALDPPPEQPQDQKN